MNDFEVLMNEFASVYKHSLQLALENTRNSKGKGLTASYSNIHGLIKSTVNSGRVILYLPDYYVFIEKGRGKNKRQPPVSAIIAWLEDTKKNIKIRDSKGRFISKTKVNLNRTAFLIARSIGKNGIRPRPFLKAAEKDAFEFFDRYIDTAVIKPMLVRFKVKK